MILDTLTELVALADALSMGSYDWSDVVIYTRPYPADPDKAVLALFDYHRPTNTIHPLDAFTWEEIVILHQDAAAFCANQGASR